jgi:hypothetical protein
MGSHSKILIKILGGKSDLNIAFSDLCALLKRLSFKERIRGDHHIFSCDKVEEILNLQPINAKVKAYQVKQVRNVILRYQLELGDGNVK